MFYTYSGPLITHPPSLPYPPHPYSTNPPTPFSTWRIGSSREDSFEGQLPYRTWRLGRGCPQRTCSSRQSGLPPRCTSPGSPQSFKVQVNTSYFPNSYRGGPGSPIALSGTEGLSSLRSHSDFSSPAASLLPRLLWAGTASKYPHRWKIYLESRDAKILVWIFLENYSIPFFLLNSRI